MKFLRCPDCTKAFALLKHLEDHTTKTGHEKLDITKIGITKKHFQILMRELNIA